MVPWGEHEGLAARDVAGALGAREVRHRLAPAVPVAPLVLLGDAGPAVPGAAALRASAPGGGAAVAPARPPPRAWSAPPRARAQHGPGDVAATSARAWRAQGRVRSSLQHHVRVQHGAGGRGERLLDLGPAVVGVMLATSGRAGSRAPALSPSTPTSMSLLPARSPARCTIDATPAGVGRAVAKVPVWRVRWPGTPTRPPRRPVRRARCCRAPPARSAAAGDGPRGVPRGRADRLGQRRGGPALGGDVLAHRGQRGAQSRRAGCRRTRPRTRPSGTRSPRSSAPRTTQ